MIGCDELHDRLLAAYGPQHWWPAEDAFEIMVGAVLVQRTAWRNAEAALGQLQRRGLLQPARLADADLAAIEAEVRSAGFFRSKAARLRSLAAFLVATGGIAALRSMATPDLRQALLELEGIGPETADVILLYAFERPAVVIDEYLRRLVRRMQGGDGAIPDAALRAWVAAGIEDVPRLNELHALVIAHGKAVCGSSPLCRRCPLRAVCATGRNGSDA